MYDRYMPPHATFRPLSEEGEQHRSAPPPPRQAAHTGRQESSAPPPRQTAHSERRDPSPGHSPGKQKPPGSDLLGELTGGLRDSLGSLFEGFSLKNLDSGDILLILIILFLYLEGDNLDLVIVLGLMLLLGLGDKEE